MHAVYGRSYLFWNRADCGKLGGGRGARSYCSTEMIYNLSVQWSNLSYQFSVLAFC